MSYVSVELLTFSSQKHFGLGRCAFGIDTDLQNNPDNIYFQKVEELASLDFRSNPFVKFFQLVPEITPILAKMFESVNALLSFINIQVLPLITEKRLHELPFTWLLNRLHPILEQRQKTPTSRVDVLQLMLQVMTEENIKVRDRNYDYDYNYMNVNLLGE